MFTVKRIRCLRFLSEIIIFSSFVIALNTKNINQSHAFIQNKRFFTKLSAIDACPKLTLWCPKFERKNKGDGHVSELSTNITLRATPSDAFHETQQLQTLGKRHSGILTYNRRRLSLKTRATDKGIGKAMSCTVRIFKK